MGPETTETQKPQYIVTSGQRDRLFAHVMGLTLWVVALNRATWKREDLPYDGEDALEVFEQHASEYDYEDVRTAFLELPHYVRKGFELYWNMVKPLGKRESYDPDDNPF